MSLPVLKPPFFYGWLIVACAACANFARQGAAVATLSMFVVPMTLEFDWSRSAISGAVSLGGVLGALTAPYLGAMVDRTGARGLLVGDRGSESVEFAVVAVVVALGWLIAQQWLQTTVAEAVSAIVARIHDLQA